jgi:amicyanin-dependent methylamine dehydrogenase large subunit
MTRKFFALVLAASIGFAAVPVAAQIDPASLPQPLTTATLPDKPDGAHWVWIAAFPNYAHADLIDADSGTLLGTIELGYQGLLPQLPRSGDEFYNHAVYMTRGYHGDLVEVVEIFDARTLEIKGEIPIDPPKAMRGLASINLTTLTDDDRFLIQSFFTPALSFGVVDLEKRKYVGEIETGGCAHTLAAGPRRFLSLCGDGSVLAVDLDDNGKESARTSHPGFFDAEGDPLHPTGTRSGDVWYMASVRGVMHAVDTSGGEISFQEPWTFREEDDQGVWVPAAPNQHMAAHDASGRLFMLMSAVPDLERKPGGYDFHRGFGVEVWVFDIESRERLARYTMERGAAAIAVSQDDSPLLYATNYADVDIYDAGTGELTRGLSGGQEVRGTVVMIQPWD